jgi:hypothetical protein
LTKPQQIEHQLRLKRKVALNRAKDEIFAFTYSPPFAIDYFLRQDGNPYDYLFIERWLSSGYSDPYYQEASQKILGIEYYQILSESAAAIDGLMKVGGYSNAEAIAFLEDKPLEEWTYFIQRLLGAKGKSLPTVQQSILGVSNDESGFVHDVVLTGPDWFKERELKDKQQSSQQTEIEPGKQKIIQDINLVMINQRLYDRTRSQIDWYAKVYGHHNLKDYFEILDSGTIALGAEFKGREPDEERFETAKLRVLEAYENLVADSK